MRAILAIAAFASLVGCQVDAVDSQVQALPADQAALPQTATLTMTDPLVPGGAIDIGLTGGVPGARYTLVRSNGAVGPGGCPPFLAGECVDITPGTSGYLPTIDITTDAAGNAAFSGILPTAVPVGINLVFQAVHVATATGSNPLARTTVVGNCPADGFESDDDTANANAIANGLTTGHVACAADDDFYTFTAVAGQVLAVDAVFDVLLGDVDIELMDDTGAVLAASIFSFTSPDPLDFNIAADGTYYLRVFLDPTRTNDPLGIAYDLNFDLVTPMPCVDDVYFPNDDAFTNAVPLTPGTITGLTLCAAADVDWYSIDLLAGDILDANIFFMDDEGDTDLYIFDAPQASDAATMDANFLARGYTASDNETVTWTAVADGTYYIGVRLYGDDGLGLVGNTYDMDLAVTPAP